MTQYPTVNIRVDDAAVDVITRAVYSRDYDLMAQDAVDRVRLERALKNVVYEALERVAVLQSVER